jgi:putative ABC transport system substrate-binding protein
VIAATGGDVSARAAQRATTTIPVVFNSATDPVAGGFVASLNRPGGNLTGVSRLSDELVPKRLELLREVVPRATTLAAFVNPNQADLTRRAKRVEDGARALGWPIEFLKVGSDSDIDAAFAAMERSRPGALLINSDSFFNSRSAKLGALTLRHGLPAMYQNRQFVAAGGLMSYGASLEDAYRLMGFYAGRIIKGEKPADLPVQQQTKIDFIINLKTAKALGLTISLPLLGRADEVIE